MIQQGTYAEISLEAIIASAKIALRIEATDSDLWLLKLANEAIRHLDTLSIFKKQICVVDILDKKSELPCGFNKLLGLRVQSPTNDGNVCQSLVYADLTFLTNCGCDVSDPYYYQPAYGAFEIADGMIYYHNITTSFQSIDPVTGAVTIVTDTPTHATLAFLGLNVNEKGEMVCYARYERAITAYICFRYAQQNFNEYPAAIRNEFHAEWIAQKKWIKSTDFQDNFKNERPQIASVLNSLISDKNQHSL